MKSRNHPIRVPQEIVEEILKELNGDCLSLYLLYHSGNPVGTDWSDTAMIARTDWHIKKLKRIQKRLEGGGWIYFYNRKGDIFRFVGIECVMSIKQQKLKELTKKPTNTKVVSHN